MHLQLPSDPEVRGLEKELREWDEASFDLVRDYCVQGNERLLNKAQQERCRAMMYALFELVVYSKDIDESHQRIHVLSQRCRVRINIIRQWLIMGTGWDFDVDTSEPRPPLQPTGSVPAPVTVA